MAERDREAEAARGHETDYGGAGHPEEDPRISGEKHPVARMIGIGVVASLIGIGISLLIDWFPVAASGAAGQIDTVYDVLLICSVPIFVLVMTIAIYSVIRFRAQPGDMSDGPPIHGNTRLEIIWVTVPFLMVSALAIYGWIVLDDIEAKQADELVVNVTGRQFTWTFEYPAAKVNSTELVLPEDQPVEFRIHTEDVVHSFWVPQFRLKSDAVAGLTTKVRLTPDRIGRYEVVCAELCGLGHSTMRQDVRVVAQRDFGTWLDRRSQAADGEAVFTANGCGSCHTLEAAGTEGTVGPDLDDISQANAAYIKESITDPNATVVKGFPRNVMPGDFGNQLSAGELDALVKYLLESQK
jgi:cytochrome c oxidase subunit 2